MSVETPLGAPRQGAFELADMNATALESAHALTGRRSRTWTERGAIAAVSSIPILGLLVCVAGTRTDALLPQSIRPVPPWMAGLFYQIGFSLKTGEVVAALVVMVLGYLFAVRHAELVSLRAVVWAVVALNVIVLLGPPLLSTDIFSYQAYAKLLALLHTNPYTHGPSVMGPDPLYNYIGADWINTPTVYGPLFTFFSAPFAWTSVAFSEFAFKLIAALSSCGIVYLIRRSAQLRGVNQTRAVAVFGLNPMVTVFGVGGGHNDLLMMLPATWGVYAFLTQRERAAGGLISAAAAVKLTAAVIWPFALAAEAGAGARSRRRAFLVGTAAVTVVVAAASGTVFGTGILDLKGTLQHVQDEGSWQSVPGFMFAVFGLRVTKLVRTVVAVGLAGAIVWLLRRVWRGQMDWIDGAGWATFALMVTAWSLLPWYAAWMMPLVALSRSRRLWYASGAITLIGGAIMVAECFPHGLGT